MDGWVIAMAVVIVVILVTILLLPWILQRLLFHPVRGPLQPPSAPGRFFMTPLSVSGVVFDRGGPLIIHSHGNAGNLSDRYALVRSQMSIVLYDYRGFGVSGPLTPTTDSILEDGESVIQYVQSEYPGRPIILWGESMGSAVTWALAKKYDIHGILITAGYASLKDVILEHVPTWVGAGLNLLGTLDHLPDNTSEIETVNVPVRLYHAEDDTLIHMRHAERMQRLTGAALIRTHGGHNFDMGPYLHEVEQWVGTLK